MTNVNVNDISIISDIYTILQRHAKALGYSFTGSNANTRQSYSAAADEVMLVACNENAARVNISKRSHSPFPTYPGALPATTLRCLSSFWSRRVPALSMACDATLAPCWASFGGVIESSSMVRFECSSRRVPKSSSCNARLVNDSTGFGLRIGLRVGFRMGMRAEAGLDALEPFNALEAFNALVSLSSGECALSTCSPVAADVSMWKHGCIRLYAPSRPTAASCGSGSRMLL